MIPNINNKTYDTLTHRIFCETLERLTNNDDHTAERCYISSNEYLSEYMCDMNLTNKKVATVGTSGDQFFNALLQGSKDVTIIDVNPYARVFVEYKMALFANLGFEEMNKTIRKIDLFHWSTYSKISHSLSPKVKQFWDTLMLEIENEIDEVVDKFDQGKLSRQLVHNEAVFFSDFYNNEEVYLKLQNLLREHQFKLKFKTADLHDFPKILKSKYDLIMLSNIYGYHNEGDLWRKFDDTVEELYNNNLNAGGSIQVHYSYHAHYDMVGPNSMAGKKLRIVRLAKDHNPRCVYFLDKPQEDLSI